MEYHVCCSCSLFCFFPSPWCSLFSLLLATGKHFLLLFHCFVPRTCVTTIGYTSLDTLATFFVCFSNFLKFCVYEHGIPCDSEKNSDGWIKSECGILPFNNGKHLYYYSAYDHQKLQKNYLPPIESHDSWITIIWFCRIV